ncbi:MAG TPA: endopygalactorunase [Chitinophagaceae bacterium]|nr:endopygalactorunase [Chitinophagaceae bacterium]
MANMSKYLLQTLIIIVAGFSAAGQTSETRNYAEVTVNNSTHIARITKDSLVVITGSTYAFTVDTHPDSGLVSTRTTTKQLLAEIRAKDGSVQQYRITTKDGSSKDGELSNGDRLIVSTFGGQKKTYAIAIQPMAVGGQLNLEKQALTVNTVSDLILYFTGGQRTPDATIRIRMPKGIIVTSENTTVNVIGRGDVKLKDLPMQSIGRVGTNYSYRKVGSFAITKLADGSSLLLLEHLDLRAANGVDLKIVINNVSLNKTGKYIFRASYSTSKPEMLNSPGLGSETAELTITPTIADLERLVDKSLTYKETSDTYAGATLRWSAIKNSPAIQLLQSTDEGKTWHGVPATVDIKKGTARLSGLAPGKLYSFRLSVASGGYKGLSNIVYFFSGKKDIKSFGIVADSSIDNTDKINEAVQWMHDIGGGTLLFSEGVYNVRTVHLKSNVYLYVSKGATIRAIKGTDSPEMTWFSDRKYRSGLSPTDEGPYAEPENYMTKQDVGHHYFHNSMFFGERLDNVKIIGNGLISGNGNLVTGDNVMRNAANNRGDKMFTFKLCTNIEIGGIYRDEDLWYDPAKDEPYYIRKDGSRDFDTGNMLQIDRAGHFALLATGTDNLNVHNTYFANRYSSNARDVYDFMQCNNVTAFNIYSKISSDDIIKPGSDCSLGFTRPAAHYKVRNIIGDTNCNLFQIGSETADDIMDIHVDNVYILGANKAGFSISTNDGGHIRDIHLNCGHTGSIHSRSKMLRSYTPFFISISNRGRIIGASVARYKFTEDTVKHDELLVTNVNIGEVENIIINGIDVIEVYAGSSFGGKNERWKAFDGTQRKATPIVAGYKLPASELVQGGLNFKLPNGMHTGYIKNIVFNDVHVLVKGGNPLSDTAANPPELGVGQYNASNLKLQPSYGLWARHVQGITVSGCSFNYETPDNRYAIFLDDVIGAKINRVEMMKVKENEAAIKWKNTSGVSLENVVYYQDEWGKSPMSLSKQ